MEVIGSNVIEDKGYSKVINNVGERAENRTLETMRRDGFLDLSKGKWGF